MILFNMGFKMEEQIHQTTLRIPVELHARLKAQAALERLSLTKLVMDLCRSGLTARGETNETRIEEFRKLVRQAAG